MAETAISADIKAANSKIAQFLRAKEEEEMLLQIGKRKPKKLEEKRQPGGRARWAPSPNFYVPTPMVDRPRTISGATSFHFSFISISKEAVPTLNGKPIAGSFGKPRQAALDHAKYIERDGAAETSAGVDHAAYVERPDVIEMVDPTGAAREAAERSFASIINESPTDEEAKLLGVEDLAPEGIPSVFSNISDDPFERQEYWRAVERCERSPKSHRIFLDPESSPRWWQQIANAEGIDPTFKNHVLQQAERYRQHTDAEASNGKLKTPFQVEPLRVTADQAGRFIEQAVSVPGYDHSQSPIEFKSGRGGRIQMRFVAELPHEITAEDRALIVQNFCDKLGSLEERKNIDGTINKVGMMYTAVIHAPDPHNDARNYHLHVVAHDRPARFREEDGLWDFEVKEHYTSHKKERAHFPYRQSKIGEVARAGNGADYSKSGRNFIPHMRQEFATITNAVLKARGIQRHYDPRKYTEMGIDRTPTEHLGTKAAALEAIGVPTTVGQLNAIAIWNDAERAITRRANKAKREYKDKQDEISQLAQQITAVDPKHPMLSELRTHIARRERLIEDLADDRRAVMSFDHMEAKAKSRAIRTRQTCLQFLADIENGKADRTTKVMKFTIQARWKDAQKHLESIDAALKPHRETMKEAAKDIERRERLLVDIDAALEPIIATLQHKLGKGAAQPAPSSQRDAHQAHDVLATASTPKSGQEADQSSSIPNEPAGEARPSGNPPNGTEPAKKSAKKGKEARVDVAIETEQDPEISDTQFAPATIDGLPIVEGTIAPSQERSDSHSGDDRDQVPGLEPLRPAPQNQAPHEPAELFIPDIAAEETVEASEPAEADPSSSPAGAIPNDPKTAEKSDQESKVDRRRKVEDPALFDLKTQEPPIKPGTSRAEHSDWENIIKRIASERIPIKEEALKNGSIRFTVPSLNEAELAVLNAKRFAFRTNNRLAAIYDRQQHEIKRLVRWISEHGQDQSKLQIEGRTASLGPVPKAIKTLMRNWGRHPDVLQAVRGENQRRLDLAKTAAKPTPPKTQTKVPTDGPSRQQLLTEAAAKYPAPDQVYTQQVANFTRLLRELAPAEKLQAAADLIHENAAAREDVNRHTVELATAYSQHVEDVDLRRAYRDRDGKGVRG